MNEDGKAIANFLMNDFKGMLKKRKLAISDSPVKPEAFGCLVRLMKAGALDRKQVKKLLEGWLDEFNGGVMEQQT